MTHASYVPITHIASAFSLLSIFFVSPHSDGEINIIITFFLPNIGIIIISLYGLWAGPNAEPSRATLMSLNDWTFLTFFHKFH